MQNSKFHADVICVSSLRGFALRDHAANLEGGEGGLTDSDCPRPKILC